MVIFGASGDLAARKILPALARLAERGALDNGFIVIGVARTAWSDEEFREHVLEATPRAAKVEGLCPAFPLRQRRVRLPRHLRRLQGDAGRGRPGGRHRRQPPLLPGHHPSRLRPGGQGSGRPRLLRSGRGRHLRPPGGREALRARPGQRHRAQRTGCTPRSTRARSSASTTTWARRPSRTSSPSGSPTPSSSRSGTAATSSRSRSPSPRASASSTAAGSTRRPGPCGTSSRTT